MKTWARLPIMVGLMGGALTRAWGGPAPPSEVAAAIQAIQQAPDPSAVVAAYANGVAIDRNNPKLYEAYVARMVDLGLPELAYHQAEFLTGIKSNNGLAWGVVAYVKARRGEMPEAISAINLAGQFGADSLFVQRTAGEIVAWHDTKADKSKLPDNATEGLAKIRRLLEKQPAFTEAYATARNAYQAQTTAPQAPAQAAPTQYAPAPQLQSQGDQVAPPASPDVAPLAYAYSPDYYYDSGPSWVEPAPWWWWHPVGCFAGFDFFPFSTFVVFDNDDFFHHHSFHHDHFFNDQAFSHDRFSHHDGLNVAFHDSNRAFFHRDGNTTFFGTAARPDTSLALSLRANFQTASGPAAGSIGLRATTSSTLIGPVGMRSTMPSMTRPPSSSFASGGALARQGTPSLGRGIPLLASPMTMGPGMMPRSNPGMMPPNVRSWGGMPHSTWAAPAFPAPRMPPPAAPTSRGFTGGGFPGGGSLGGGFHGGGMHG